MKYMCLSRLMLSQAISWFDEHSCQYSLWQYKAWPMQLP